MTEPDYTKAELAELAPSLPELADDLHITERWIMQQLQAFSNDTDKDGAATPAALTALTTLAKMRGMLVERSETTHTGGVRVEIVGIPDTKELR